MKKTASISIPPRAALRAALSMLWQVIRHPRSWVTFDMSEDV
jgi:hypothetical protein